MGYFAELFQMPTRGGKLTMVNCCLWGVVALGGATNQPALVYPAFIACWPIGWWILLPSLHRSSQGEVVFECVMIGLNAFAWGYGLSWLITRFIRRTGPKSPMRGFEVVPLQAEGPPSASEVRGEV